MANRILTATEIFGGPTTRKTVLSQADFVRWMQAQEVFVSPEMFRASGNGAANDDDPVRAALAEIGAAGGGVLRLKDGASYYLGDDEKIVVPNKTVIIGRASILWSETRTQPLLEVQEDCEAELYGIRFNGGYLSSPSTADYSDLALAVLARSVARLRVMHCTFENIKGDGVYVGETIGGTVTPRDVTVQYNRFHNVKRNSFACVTGMDIRVHDNVITSDSDFKSNISAAIDFEPNNQNSKFLNISVLRNRIDVYGSAAPLRLDIGTLKQPTVCRGIDFSGNDINGNGDCSIGVLVNGNMLVGGADDVRINDNIVHQATTAGVWALRCGNNLEIAGNDLRECARFIRDTNAAGDHHRIIGNKGYRDDAALTGYAVEVTLLGSALENLWIEENSFTDAVGTTSESIFVIGGTNLDNCWMSRNYSTGFAGGQRVFQAGKVFAHDAVAEKLVLTACTVVTAKGNQVAGELNTSSNTTVWVKDNKAGSWTRNTITTLIYDGNVINGYRTDNEGFVSGTTDGSGDITVTHGMLAAPLIVMASASGATFRQAQPHSVDATTFKVRIMDAAGSALAATAVNIHWRARIA